MRELLTRVRRFFCDVDELDEAAAAAAELELQDRDDIERAARDPFRFCDEAAWQRFRVRHGFRRHRR